MAISPDSPGDITLNQPLADVRLAEQRAGDSATDSRVRRRPQEMTDSSSRMGANSLWNGQESSGRSEEDLFGSDDELYDGDDGEAPFSDYQLRQDEDNHQLVIMKTIYPSDSNWSQYPAPTEKDGTINRALRCMKILSESISLLPPFEGTIDYAQAVETARSERQQIDAFEGYEETDGPPWMSQHEGHTVIVDVVDRGDYADFLQQRNEAKEYLEERIHHYNALLDMEEGQMVMQVTGTKTFYSYPVRKLWNIKADIEIRETDNPVSDALMKIRPDSYGMRSLMYRGNMGGCFGNFLCDLHEDIEEFDTEKVGLLRHLCAIDDLKELFLEVYCVQSKFRAHITDKFFKVTAPKISNLQVLSFGPGLTVHPETLSIISQTLLQLQRLDISTALSREYSRLSDHNEDDENNIPQYYDFPLVQSVTALQFLLRLDIGDKVCPSDSDDAQKEWTVPINSRALASIDSVMKSRGGIITRSAQTLPPPWPTPYDQRHCRKIAIENIVNNPKKDADLRNIAYWQLLKRRALDAVQNEHNATGTEPVVVEEDLGYSSHEDLTVTNQSSNKRRHDEIDTLPDASKVPRLP